VVAATAGKTPLVTELHAILASAASGLLLWVRLRPRVGCGAQGWGSAAGLLSGSAGLLLPAARPVPLLPTAVVASNAPVIVGYPTGGSGVPVALSMRYTSCCAAEAYLEACQAVPEAQGVGCRTCCRGGV
jgi:hypothetical protein